ncbi:MAG: PEFG-CTERM sorting domain-containing protein [Nitrosotalea sp.]
MHLRTVLFTMAIITFTTLAFTNISTSIPFVTIPAYAQQTPGTSLPNPADLGLPADNSSSSSASSDNSTDLNALSPSTADLGAVSTNSTNPAYTQTTQSATVPEFGPVSLAVLVVSVMSIIIVSARTRLRFS